MSMLAKRLFILLLIIAFLAPAFKSLAYSMGEAGAICNLETMDCKHGKSCPLKNRSKAAHKVSHEMTSAGDHESQNEKHKCDTFLECGANNDSSRLSTSSKEAPFITTPVHFNTVQTFETLESRPPPLYKDALGNLPHRPPALL